MKKRLKRCLKKFWIWHGYIAMTREAENPIYIVGTKIFSYIEKVQLYDKSLGLCLTPPWEGGWLLYPFFIYMIIYVLTWYLIWFPIWTGDNFYIYMMITLYKYNDMSMMGASLTKDTEIRSSSPVWAPRVWNLDRGIMGLREL